MADIEWRNRAACRDMDPDLFFPLHSSQAGEAKRICVDDCTVRAQCAIQANALHVAHGVHGGYALPEQRKSLRRYVEMVRDGRDDSDRTVVGICEKCGAEMHNRIKLTVCGSCRALDRDDAVSIDPAREHIEDLRSRGWTLKAIYEAADVSQPTATRIAHGRIDMVSRRIVDKICAVKGDPPPRRPGMCPECGGEKPAMAASPKSGLRGHCSKRCRDVGEQRRVSA